MSELLEVYVDPSLSASPETGDGSIGTPYASIENAIRSTAWNADGIRFNIKAGTEITLEQDLFITCVTEESYAPTWNACLVFQGYTAAAGDGGKAEINCDGDSLWDDGGTRDGMWFIDLKARNTGSNAIINSDDGLTIGFCELSDCGRAAGDFDMYAYQSYFRDCVAISVDPDNYGSVDECFFLCDDPAGTAAFQSAGTRQAFAYRCIFKMTSTFGGDRAFYGVSSRNSVINCSFWADGNAATALDFINNGNPEIIMNNVIAGFSGSGGVGIKHSGDGNVIRVQTNNSIYDCETNEDTTTKKAAFYNAAETLTSSPFTDPANDDFSPNNVGSIKEGSYPTSIGQGSV